LIAVTTIGVALSSNKPSDAVVPESEVEAQRKALHERVERVRAALTIEAGAVIEPDARSRLAQWYNWGNWPNGWNNYWNNWPNGWWNG
jgi:nitric oxide reductase large subunit